MKELIKEQSAKRRAPNVRAWESAPRNAPRGHILRSMHLATEEDASRRACRLYECIPFAGACTHSWHVRASQMHETRSASRGADHVPGHQGEHSTKHTPPK